jgi:hypothetical protein
MKKKRTPSAAANQDSMAAAGTPRGRGRKTPRCVICGNDVAPFSIEELCWVCRRLKISAWRDSDNQASIQE